MPENKNKPESLDKNSELGDELEEFKNFIKKKKLQNVALKKIIARLNIDKNHTPNK